MHDGNEHARRQLLVFRCEADADRDQGEPEQLPAPAQPERAPVRELDEVVEEPDRAAAEGDEEDGERRNLVLRHREKRPGGDDEDQEAAHRRGSLLDAVSLRQLLADVLAELVLAQEGDELRADDDRHDHRDHACGQDADHWRVTGLGSL